jgi:hypothetical protein
MKSIWKNSQGKVIYFLALGLSLIPGRAVAQLNAPVLNGTFTLSSPVRWEKTVLQPGSYWISLDALSTSSPFTIVKICNSKRMVASFISEAHSHGHSSVKNVLTLEQSGDMAVVRSLELPGLGAAFYYPVPKATTLIARGPAASPGISTLSTGN